MKTSLWKTAWSPMRTLTHTPVGSWGHDSKYKTKATTMTKTHEKNMTKILSKTAHKLTHMQFGFWSQKYKDKRWQKKVTDIDKHIDLSGIIWIKARVWSSRGKLNRKVLFIELRLNVYLGSVPNYWSHYNITMQWMMFQPPFWKFSSKQSSWKPL